MQKLDNEIAMRLILYWMLTAMTNILSPLQTEAIPTTSSPKQRPITNPKQLGS